MSRQEKFDTIQNAISKLNAVHTEMMKLMMAGELEREDFDQIYSLYDQLNELAEKSTPSYCDAAWAEIISACKKAG